MRVVVTPVAVSRLHICIECTVFLSNMTHRVQLVEEQLKKNRSSSRYLIFKANGLFLSLPPMQYKI